MKLYYFEVAPNPTKVRLYLAEKAAGGAELEVELVRVDPRTRHESALRDSFGRKALTRLPLLELDDGSLLSESLVLLEYFEALAPDPPLFGASALERARVQELERLAEGGVLYPIARIVHATDSPFRLPPNPGVAEHYRAALRSGLRALEHKLSDGRPFLAGEAPTVADCTLAAGLQFGRFGGLPLDPACEHVARWDERYRARPPAQEVLTH